MAVFLDLWHRALSPAGAFRQRASEAPTLWSSVKIMLFLRTPLTLASTTLGYWGFRRAWHSALGSQLGSGGMADWAQGLSLSINPEDWRRLVAELPRLPDMGRVMPWLALAAPIGVLSIWLHDAVWDHGCLWMLGGLKAGRGSRSTLIAEAEVLSVGSLGAALGLLGYLPYLGWTLALPLAAVAVWFWVLRGYALAAWHDCPVWKGVAATLLHAVFAGCCLAALAGFCVLILFMAFA